MWQRVCLVFIVFFLALFPSLGFTKRVRLEPMPVSKVLNYLEGVKKDRKLNYEEIYVYSLAILSDHILHMKTFLTVETKGGNIDKDDIKTLKLSTAINSIAREIHEHPNWDTPVSNKEKELVSENLEPIRSDAKVSEKYGIGQRGTYVYAWFLYKSGKKEEAKKTLDNLFDSAYESTMKIPYIGSQDIQKTDGVEVKNPEPFEIAGFALQALEALTSSSEQAHRKEKMEKMKNHVNSLGVMDLGIID